MFIMETQQICLKCPKWYSGYKIKKAPMTAGWLTEQPSLVIVQEGSAKPRRSATPTPLPARARIKRCSFRPLRRFINESLNWLTDVSL